MNLPLNIDFQQILLHLLNFVILAGGLYLLLYGPVKKFMDKRETAFAEREQSVKDGLQKAEDLKAEYEKRIAASEEEVAKIKSDAAKKAAAEGEAAIEQAKAQAADIVVAARKEALHEKDRIMTEAQKEISDLAADAAEKLISQSTSDSFDSFLDDAERGAENE